MNKKYKSYVFLSLICLTLFSCGNTDVTPTPDPDEGKTGYIRGAMDYGASDLSSTYALTNGNQQALVILVEFEDGGYTFDDSTISNLFKSYFGSRYDTAYNWNSLRSFYRTASYGSLNMGGQVTAVYHTDVTAASIKENDEIHAGEVSNPGIVPLYNVYENAINAIKDGSLLDFEGNKIDLTTYDNNKDGYIDSPTFVTNVNDEQKWATAFWPHMDDAFRATEKEWSFRVYSSTNLGHIDFTTLFDGARTVIHEQGHVFGLDDYYDYTTPKKDEQTIEPLGAYDMQSYAMFDWNPYSKMLAKWVSPYVIDGTRKVTTINIGDAAETGDYILIPANYSTYNGTPYDEYLILELFSPLGNNKIDWEYTLQEYKNLGDYGIRLYHVDSRLYGYNDNGGEWIVDPRTTTYTEFEKPTNCTNNEDYGFSHLPKDEEGCRLIQIIQAGKVDTFTDTATTARHTLNSTDLFHTGDSFSFNEYKDFFPNKGTTMNNGESFNYTIDFNSVSLRNATVTITLNS